MVRQLLTIAVMTLSVSNISFGQQSAFEVADTALNNNYQALMQTLPTAEQALLRDVQRLWIRYTDAKCRFEVALDEKQFANCKSKETLKRSQEFSTLLASQKEAAKMKREFSTQLKDVLTNIESIPVEEYDRIYWPGGSAHTIVTQFLKKISLNYVVNQYGKPIFLEGPHSETVVNLESTTEFGHYDPAFLSWLDQQFVDLMTKFYRAYNPEDLAKIENKAYQVPRELPGGKIKF